MDIMKEFLNAESVQRAKRESAVAMYLFEMSCNNIFPTEWETVEVKAFFKAYPEMVEM